MKILFICTGNICRSPGAEAMLRHKLETASKTSSQQTTHSIDSAGIAGYHIGDPPDRRAIEVGQKYGFDMSELKARKVDQSDFAVFDLILAMDSGHYEHLLNIAPQAQHHKIKLFLDYTSPETQDPPVSLDVADPYYGDIRDFEFMMRQLNDHLDMLAKKITSP